MEPLCPMFKLVRCTEYLVSVAPTLTHLEELYSRIASHDPDKILDSPDQVEHSQVADKQIENTTCYSSYRVEEDIVHRHGSRLEPLCTAIEDDEACMVDMQGQYAEVNGRRTAVIAASAVSQVFKLTHRVKDGFQDGRTKR